MYILCIHIIYNSFSLGQTAAFFFFFFLPYDEFVWRASSSWTKALMHIPFYVKWVVLFPEESCTVKTSLVVTHSVFMFLNHYYTSWILLTTFVIFRWFVKWSLVDAILCTAEVKSCLLLSFLLISVWAGEQQDQNGWTDFLCFVNIKNDCSVCMSLCGSGVFL